MKTIKIIKQCEFNNDITIHTHTHKKIGTVLDVQERFFFFMKFRTLPPPPKKKPNKQTNKKLNKQTKTKQTGGKKINIASFSFLFLAVDLPNLDPVNIGRNGGGGIKRVYTINIIHCTYISDSLNDLLNDMKISVFHLILLKRQIIKNLQRNNTIQRLSFFSLYIKSSFITLF